MIVGLFAVLLIVALGGRAVDELRRKEAENILGRLPGAEARAYYDVLRRRMRRIVLMRATAILSLLWIFFVYRQRLVQHHTAAGRPAPSATTTISTPAP